MIAVEPVAVRCSLNAVPGSRAMENALLEAESALIGGSFSLRVHLVVFAFCDRRSQCRVFQALQLTFQSGPCLLG